MLISNLLKVLNIIIYVNDRALLIKRYDVGRYVVKKMKNGKGLCRNMYCDEGSKIGIGKTLYTLESRI